MSMANLRTAAGQNSHDRDPARDLVGELSSNKTRFVAHHRGSVMESITIRAGTHGRELMVNNVTTTQRRRRECASMTHSGLWR